MHSQRLAIGRVTHLPDARSRALRAYLDQLADNLDDSSLQAALKLMMCETRGAIQMQRGQIALERLQGRDTAERLDMLRELETMHEQLVAFYIRDMDAEDDFSLQASPSGVGAAGPRSVAQPMPRRALPVDLLPLLVD